MVVEGALALAEGTLNLGYERGAGGELLTRSTDPADVTTVAFHLVRTPEGNRWLVSEALPPATRAALEAALRAEPVVALADLDASPPRIERTLADLLPGSAAPTLYRGPAFVFPEALVPPRVPVELMVEPRSLRTVRQLDWVRDALPAAHPLCVARNTEGEVVAVCHSSRSDASAAAAGVETAEAYRARGLGTAVVAGWAAALRAEGRLPLYGTTWDNTASRAIATRLGLAMFGEDVHA